MKKKILSFALCITFLVSVLSVLTAPVGAATSGLFGNGMYWSFDSDTGILEFSGNGAINSGDSLAWYPSIDSYAVTEIALSSGVTGVESGAIADYMNVSVLSISDTVVMIDDYSFSFLPALETINVDENNPAYRSEGNCLIEKGTGRLILGTNLSVIPEGVSSIAAGAFEGYEGLTSLSIPASLSRIDPEAIRNCSGINEITAAPGNPVYRADGNCLIERATGKIILGCSGSVIPDDGSILEIGEAAFMGCIGLETVYIPDSVATIGAGAFAECISLTEARLPAGLEAIPDGMFSNCPSLTEIDLPDGLNSIGEGAFFFCASLTEIYVPDGVETIGGGAFCGCENVTSVRLPEGLREIAPSTFESCLSIEELLLPESLEVIGESAFVDCASLTSLDIPDGVTEIGNNAFACCASITDIDLPDSLETIGYGAFANCESLETLVLPESLMKIESSAFIDSSLILTEYGNALYLGTEDNPYYALIESAGDFITSCQIHPDTKIISDLAFEGNDGLEEIKIPEGVKAIGDGAFEGCSGLESVKIPRTVVSIGAGVFGGCTSIKKIVVPIRVLLEAADIFDGCDTIEDVACDATPEEWEEYADQIDPDLFGGADVHIAPPEPVLGDIDGDGALTVRDLTLLKKILSGSVTPSEEELAAADIDGDGSVAVSDLRALKKLLSAGEI